MNFVDLRRPSDDDAFRASLRAVRQKSGAQVAFAGRCSDDGMRLTDFAGALTKSLHGLLIAPGAGLGGQVFVSRRPSGAHDYARNSSITHEYDRPVLAEGIRSVVAAPIVVGGEVRGVLYAAVRAHAPLGERSVDSLVAITRSLAGELHIRDAVDSRLRIIGAAEVNLAASGLGFEAREELREIQSELRRLARLVNDADVRGQLQLAGERLTNLGRPAARSSKDLPRLTKREVDVLVEVALGSSNAEIAQRLSLSAETVKAYLSTAMRKLDVHNRHEAVVIARRHGLLL